MTEGCAGVFSSCLVPTPDPKEADIEFREQLSALKVTLVELLESFPVDGDELDPNDPINKFWIEWCNEVREKGCVLFDTWHYWGH